MAISFRAPRIEDLNDIAEIYNHAVRTTAATFDTEEKLPSYFSSFVPGDHLHRMRVAVDDRDRVVAYAGIYPFSQRQAYAQLAEMMVYVHPAWQRRGISRALLAELHRGGGGVAGTGGQNGKEQAELESSQGPGEGLNVMISTANGGSLRGLHTVLALINSENVHMHRVMEELGYARKGELEDVATKFGRRHSLVVYQRHVAKL
ncbi:acyl-CoA N-acyltransferase [Apiosordaria backusii]|uniref:Acyl-CoA N-acyltransferase n=1 Tax=Apiosordaria backusii TaxID=314023 RepID=A0AA39ZPX0_9PEZI|nr:acyl-CoA N-acyltransferase [Apiosordaria backusii]